MPPRKWRTLTTCAALLLATTGCALGPTIKDAPKQPAAATAGPTDKGTNAAQAPNPSGADALPSPGVPAPPSTATEKPKVLVGAETPVRFRDGTQVWIARVGDDTSAASGEPRAVVDVRIVNGSGGKLRPYSITLELTVCPDGRNGRCVPGGRTVGDSEPIAPGQSGQSPRYFTPPASGLPEQVTGYIEYNSERFGFEGRRS
ncbi:hypothetical protein LO772_23875 [Yinghuangia sp. ASG 101]|uniref:hypothetical protein n=1 Tax=Yinghuangia sp. ASG 101 TaxID=2896848 RepID=UPI001E2928A6|nr:hypothetical protein [Yinghuangia sp. ASG 101]UGQ09916.1 hypothetical protein LO772_23875 [Yinghuangia sp. ASG 101]